MKKIKLGSLAVDLKREREGEWVDSRAFEGVAYFLKSTNAPDYTSVIRKAARTMTQAIRDGKEISEDKSFAEEGERICEHLLLGWKGFDIEYTPDGARETLKDPAYRPLLNDIMMCADRVGRKQIEFVEEDAKN